jgi:hypothetical protein
MTLIVDKEYIQNILFENIAIVTFTKKDGTSRVMKCTLDPEILPKKLPLPVIEESANFLEEMFKAADPKSNPPRNDNSNVICVWDIENSAWKSFRLDSITSFEI